LPKKTFEAAEKAGAHVIAQLKENQPTLHESVETFCADAEPLDVHGTRDKNRRNRDEIRTCGIYDARSVVAGTEWETYVACIIMVERTVYRRRTSDGLLEESFERSFYLSNRPIEAEQACEEVRKHWAIENSNHYVRDVTMGEDASRIRCNPGIFARLRSFASNILRKNPTGKKGGDTVSQMRHKAAFGGLDYVLSMQFM
jgi:predicted transposase YbfD/YdcC